MVGRGAVPAAEAGPGRTRELARRVVFVVEGLEVGGDGGGVGLREARQGEGAGDKFAGGGV